MAVATLGSLLYSVNTFLLYPSGTLLALEGGAAAVEPVISFLHYILVEIIFGMKNLIYPDTVLLLRAWFT